MLVGLLLASCFGTSKAVAGGYNTPTASQSPHGGYSDASTKCKVCHAAHNAAASVETTYAPPEALMRTRRGVTRAGSDYTKNGMACVYCHITGEWSIKKVYDGLLVNYQSDSRYNHDDNHRLYIQMFSPGTGANYSGCMSCHSIHGANVLAGYESAIVKANPNPDWDAITPTTLTDFCRDCHDDPLTSPNPGTYGYRCNWCHGGFGTPDQRPPFFNASRDGNTHIMTTTLTGNSGTQVAWNVSADCRDCHNGGTQTPANSFPHFTAGAQFLDDNYQSGTGMDKVCLNCHVEGGDGASYTTGIGKTF
ncbi:MAG: hypothetical protein C4521_13340 [Actinobacteria bacterium]|nr:MAG: hypothetical protein C4521_13340 [Actinomycetota bacterium]